MRQVLFVSILLLTTLCILQSHLLAYTEDTQPKRPMMIKTVFVERFGNSDKAKSFKNHLESYLQEYGFHLTSDRYQADAVVTGNYRSAQEQLLMTADRSPTAMRYGQSPAVQNSTNPGIRINVLVQSPHQNETLWRFSTRGFFTKRLAHKAAKKFRKATFFP